MKLGYGLLALAGLGFVGSGCATTPKYPIMTVTKSRCGFEARVTLIDSNKDGKADMLKLKLNHPSIPNSAQEHLYVDKDFNGSLDAIFIDAMTADHKKGLDGIYDVEMPFETGFNKIKKRLPTEEERTVEGFYKLIIKDFS